MSNQNTSHGSKLDSASLLILGMESLSADDLMPVSEQAVREAGTVKDAADRQRYGTALSCVVLYAIVVELVLKHIWEQEHGKTAKHSHDVLTLFTQLGTATRREVKELYDECRRSYERAVESGRKQHGADSVPVKIASLEEALRWNEAAVKDLKYEMTPRGQSVPAGIFWSSSRVWVLPGTFPNFAIKLTRWAAGRFKHSSPQAASP